eukprot:CAMPEP_0196761094 /NCGR_PEP_ID=MMETSP1095-20130614/215_1 /TAXON_ID=96789 ORGANISM="Chromulina nebulosa, Strain UTEXLB2642" /NCGR_SAMPLE_ID=MMETSP1095 /ASSEMBLY_ACC=CAM_ASM_000446 /LENGTH=223 /DNA_ID=CAMNT_0042110189 /DNA_START=64 /DNA_END=732 /DNA_ORIENTATION=+
MDDPFYTVRDNVQSQVDRIKVSHEKFQGLIRNTDTSSNSEFKDLRKALVKDLRSADKDLQGLKDAVDMVEKNRSKFPRIKDPELASRRKFVNDTQAIIQEIKSSMESASVRRKIENDSNKSNRYSEGSDVHNSLIEQENNRFIKDQKLQVKESITKQDESLEQLGSAVDRLGVIGKDINSELKDQNKLLDNLESEIGEASDRMGVVMGALSKLLKTKDGCQIW